MNKQKLDENLPTSANQKQPDAKTSSGRGFASMDQERQKEIASKGGKAAHLSGNAHQFTSEEAREAGRKGGQANQGIDANFNQKRGIDSDVNSRRSNVEQDDEIDFDETTSKSRSTDNSKY